MADSEVFDFVCNELEQRTNLDRLEARGTLRIALKDAGLDARSVTAGQLRVVFEKVMPLELGKRGVKDAEETCAAVIEELASAPASADEGSSGDVDGIFRRLGGN